MFEKILLFVESYLTLSTLIPYFGIGFFVSLFAFDNPPKWVEKYHLEIVIVAIITIFWLPILIIGLIIEFIKSIIKTH